MSSEKTNKPSEAILNRVRNILNNNGWPSSLTPSMSVAETSNGPQSERWQIIQRKKDKLFCEMLINNSVDFQLQYISLFTEEINCLSEELEEKNDEEDERYDTLIEKIYTKNVKICDILRPHIIETLTSEEIDLLQDAIISIAEDFVKHLNHNEATLGFCVRKLTKDLQALFDVSSLNRDKFLRAVELIFSAYKEHCDGIFIAGVMFLCGKVDFSSDPILSAKKATILTDCQSKLSELSKAMCSSRAMEDNKARLSEEIKRRNDEISKLSDSLARSSNHLDLAMRWLNEIMDFAAFLAEHPECSFSDPPEKIAQMERNILSQLTKMLQNPQLKKLKAEDSKKFQEGCLYVVRKRLNRQMTLQEFEENKRYISALEGLIKLPHLDLTVMTELSQELQKPRGKFVWSKKEKDSIQKIAKKVSELKPKKLPISTVTTASLPISFQDGKDFDIARIEVKNSMSDETDAAQSSEELPNPSVDAESRIFPDERYNAQENSTPARKTKIRRDRRGKHKSRGLAPRREIAAESLEQEAVKEEPVVFPAVVPSLEIEVSAPSTVADTSCPSPEITASMTTSVMPVVSTNFLLEQNSPPVPSKKAGLTEKIIPDCPPEPSSLLESIPERSSKPAKKSSIVKPEKAILPRGKKEEKSQPPVPEISFKHELQHRAAQLNQAYQQWVSFQQREAIRYQSFLYNQAARQCMSNLSLESMTTEEQHIHQKFLTNAEMASMILEFWSVKKLPRLKEQLFQQYQEEHHGFTQWIREQTRGLAVEPLPTDMADVLVDDVWITYYELQYLTAQNPAVIEDLARLTKMQEDLNILLQEPTWMISALRLELYHHVVLGEALKCYLIQYGAAILQRAMSSQPEALMTELWASFYAGKAVEFYSLLYRFGYLSILFPVAVKNMNDIPGFSETVMQNMQASDAMPVEYRCRSHLLGRILCRAEELQKAPVGGSAFFAEKADTKEMMPSTSASHSNGHTVRRFQPQSQG